MSYATLLVPVEICTSPDAPVALATKLANRFDASLVGVGAEIGRMLIVGDAYDGGYNAATLLDMEDSRIKADLQTAEASFSAAAGAVKAGAEWRPAGQVPLAAVADEARSADLIVVGRPVHHGDGHWSNGAIANLVLAVGRPVLVVPNGLSDIKLGTVLVAWKDAREARRALEDALPFLQQADAVVVAEVCPHDSKTESEARVAQVAAHLARHGVRASSTVAVEESGVSPAKQLLELADQLGAGLIVAGAYGHLRVQEWVLGGFTQTLLAQKTRPVLLSH